MTDWLILLVPLGIGMAVGYCIGLLVGVVTTGAAYKAMLYAVRRMRRL